MAVRTPNTYSIELSEKIRQNSNDKKIFNLSKKSNIKNMLPSIQIPTAKRVVRDIMENSEKKQQKILQKSRKKEQGQKQKNSQGKKKTVKVKYGGKILKNENQNSNQLLLQKQLMNWVIKTNVKTGVYLTHQSEINMKFYIKSAFILSYIYNQFDKIQTKQMAKYKVYHDWQIMQIQQNYRDTNLGDFVIKLVNPDNIQKEYEKKSKIFQNSHLSLTQSMQIYDQMFNTQQSVDKQQQQCEKVAFQICFYLLNFQLNIRSEFMKRQTNRKQIQNFLQLFDYLIKIRPLTFSQYLQLKKDQQFKEFQSILYPFLSDLYESTFNSAQNDKQFNMQNCFSSFKDKIYLQLKHKLNKSEKPKLQYHREQINYLKQNQFLSNLLVSANSISKLFILFPELVERLIINMNEQNDGKSKDIKNRQIRKKLAYGGYLSKVSQQGEMKWVQSKNRPDDILTLLRKFLIYKLTKRGGLFIRSFLSRQQTHLYLVIKASQKHLQKMAQQLNFNMQVQLGSIDIFSFEPVDKYGRPLRCNKYLRDINFIKKYNLLADQGDKDPDLGDKSVESQALTIYNKAIKMNQDELRAKIILDQFHCDQLFHWVSLNTGARLIQHDSILNNQYNSQQIEEEIWPAYYVYNKLIIQYVSKLRLQFQMQKKNKTNIRKLNNQAGLTLRLMFLKSLNFVNRMFLKYRKAKFKWLRNLFFRRHPLQTIWNQMREDFPRGYYPYFYSQKNEKIWRKYQINQQRDRSKFTPSDRLVITNNIIRQNVNISKSLIEKMVVDFYPIHDPFILKHIKVRPFLNVLSGLLQSNPQIAIQEPNSINFNDTNTYIQYECDYTIQDFTKESMQEKLKFKCKNMTQFSVNTVAFYCGQKLAFFFQFRRFLAEKAWPLTIVSFLIQILFWVQKSHLATYGTSNLTNFNNALVIIMIVINIFWVSRTIKGWQYHQKKLARSFGTNDLYGSVNSQKRVLFEGNMERNLQTNHLNDQMQSKIFGAIKILISFLINILFVALMATIILLILAFKIQLYQSGAAQSTVTQLPSILISITIKVLVYVHSTFIIGKLINFENKKTIHHYQDSLASKSFIITFIVTYFVIIIYGFFQQYFEGSVTCLVKLDSGKQIKNCYYFMSNQIVTDSITNLIFTIVQAVLPFLLFYLRQYLSQKKENNNISFNLNYFESIDCFYEQQDKMETYMYTDEIDKTWQGYIQIMIAFTTLALFAPIVPFLYMMMFLVGVITLNTKKRQIIYYSRRTLPIKANSIGIWIKILKVISVIGVFVNVALAIFVRNIVTDSKSIVFFSCVFLILVAKYFFTFQIQEADYVGKRCKARIKEISDEKKSMNINVKIEDVNTDIQNLFYDQVRLKRTLPTLKGAKIAYK